MNGEFRFYTMANDRMAVFFERFLEYFSVFGQGSRLHVIPFDDNIERIVDIASKRSDIDVILPHPEIDAIGKRIFQHEEYRPDIPAWRYFRKLNAFADHSSPFLFADVNSLLLTDIRAIATRFTLDGRSMYFGGKSAPARTIRDENARQFLSTINPNIDSGFNCGFILSRGGTLDLQIASALSHSDLRKIIGKAPEQGFLTFYIGVCGLAHGIISEMIPELSPPIKGLRSWLEDRGDGFLRVTLPPYENRLMYGLKYTGQDFHSEPDVIRRFLECAMSPTMATKS